MKKTGCSGPRDCGTDYIYQPLALPETESQTARGRGVPSGTPARVVGACSRSVGQGNAWTSTCLHCAAPKHSHSLSAWSSEHEACRAEPPAATKGRRCFKRHAQRPPDCINSTLNHEGKSHSPNTEESPPKVEVCHYFASVFNAY